MLIPFPQSIETERLRLRPPLLQDARTIFDAYTQDPVVCRFLVWIPHKLIEDTEQFIRSCMNSWDMLTAFPYVITRNTNGDVIGMLEARPTGHRLNLGYVLARPYWGQGIMPEAIRAVTDLALSRLSFLRVEATCDMENERSIRTLEKSGFKREGLLSRYTVHPNISAAPRDCWMYAVYR